MLHGEREISRHCEILLDGKSQICAASVIQKENVFGPLTEKKNIPIYQNTVYTQKYYATW